MQLQVALAHLLLLFTATADAAARKQEGRKCYNIDGSINTFSWPCNNATTGHSTCCEPGATCWSNGVCAVPNPGHEPDYQRVGCTDPTWNDPSCLKRCEQFGADRATPIKPCNGIANDTHYCCDDGSGSDCCNNSSDIFVVTNTVPTIAAKMPLSGDGSAASTSSAGAAGSDGPTESAAAGKGGGKGGGGGKTSDGGGSGGNNTAIGLGVGLGVGFPLAAAVAGGVFFAVWRTHRKDRRQDAAAMAAATAAATAASSSSPLSASPWGDHRSFDAVLKSPSSYASASPGLPTAQAMNHGLPPGELPAVEARTELPA